MLPETCVEGSRSMPFLPIPIELLPSLNILTQGLRQVFKIANGAVELMVKVRIAHPTVEN